MLYEYLVYLTTKELKIQKKVSMCILLEEVTDLKSMLDVFN